MRYILLTPEQANEVRGESTPGHWLVAGVIPDGQYAGGQVLPISVLSDPSHAAKHDYLAALPQIDYTPSTEEGQ